MNNLEVESESKKSRRRTKRRKGENGVSEDCVLFDEQVMKFVWSSNEKRRIAAIEFLCFDLVY